MSDLMSYRVGVDIGGTFTDFCAFNEQTNELHTLKVPSRPDQPGAEVIAGIRQLQQRFAIAPQQIHYFTHGTTVGVNTIIQRKGIKLCLFTTENFVDVLEVARLKMPDPYDLNSKRPDPLIPKDRVLPIKERLLADGSPDQPVDEASVIAAVEKARDLGAEGIVIALINAYRNPIHEQQVKTLIERIASDLAVFCSTDVWSIIREYERTITAVIHAYVQPRVSHYLSSLQNALTQAGVPAQALVTKSNGGVMSAELGKTACAQMLLSGTASGVIGASFIASLAGFSRTMSLDIGGTSADVAFIENGQPQYGVGEMIGDFPLYIPSVSVSSIGAGGGSIAWVDELGVLKVGPESAGSRPGPACYGHGSTQPTVTDAFAVLGFIGQTELGYNAIQVDVDKARTAIAGLAKHLDLAVDNTAEAIVRIAVSGMYMEISKLASSYGIDPRDYTLQAFGGAGPMLACFVAAELGIKNTLIPPRPGVLSALGGLIADIKNDFIHTLYIELDSDAMSVIQQGFKQLTEQARHWLNNEQGYRGNYELLYSADMRYRGQSYEIEVMLNHKHIAGGDNNAIAEAFHQQHEKIYEHADRTALVQIINLRLVIIGQSPKPVFLKETETDEPARAVDMIEVYLNGQMRSLPRYSREDLKPGQHFQGPAVITQDDCTSCIPDHFQAYVDAYRNIVLINNENA